MSRSPKRRASSARQPTTPPQRRARLSSGLPPCSMCCRRPGLTRRRQPPMNRRVPTALSAPSSGRAPMKLADLIQDIPLIASGSPPQALEISGITEDSRRVAPGMLFAALPGTKADGMAFAEDAARRGAAAILAGADARAGSLPAGFAGRRAKAGAGATRGAILRRAARNRRGCHRHERQNIGRIVRSPNLGSNRY